MLAVCLLGCLVLLATLVLAALVYMHLPIAGPGKAAPSSTAIEAVDLCPRDDNKTHPGRCGCGRPDTDTDLDNVADCNDRCPEDATKWSSPGACGCGVADVDSDGDGTPDCHDVCPKDPTKATTAGICGCGQSEADDDHDGVPNCVDLCPNDSNKTTPGVCGCGVSDVDSDGDGVHNCHDGCPWDAAKSSPGVCGCGVEDVDSDGDQTMDCMDLCPDDPNKAHPGVCGCGASDEDSDADGVPDCVDACDKDANKVVAGACNCGTADVDEDGDGHYDCHDVCADDPDKPTPGVCGCGVSDVDSDGDGTPDCIDACPHDGSKLLSGVCGCGVSDVDSDGDGFYDNCAGGGQVQDGCPDDSSKSEPGVCGCGAADTDTDGDGTPDCVDSCPLNPHKSTGSDCTCALTSRKSILSLDSASLACPMTSVDDTDGIRIHPAPCHASNGHQEGFFHTPLNAMHGVAVEISMHGGSSYSCCYSATLGRPHTPLSSNTGWAWADQVHMSSAGYISTNWGHSRYTPVTNGARNCWVMMPVSDTQYTSAFYESTCAEALSGSVAARDSETRVLDVPLEDLSESYLGIRFGDMYDYTNGYFQVHDVLVDIACD